jgi:hypothetical protein
LFKYTAPKTKLITVLVNWNRSRVRPFICAAIHIMRGQKISTGATDILTVFKFISHFLIQRCAASARAKQVTSAEYETQNPVGAEFLCRSLPPTLLVVHITSEQPSAERGE